MRIFITGEIEEKSCEKWMQDIISSTDRNIYIYINSCGGDAEPAIFFASYLRSCHRNVTTIVTGQCMGAAVPIFMAGTERWAVSEACFMLHPGADECIAGEESLNRFDLESLVKKAKQFDEKLYKASLIGSSVSLKTLCKKVDEAEEHEWQFTTKEAQTYGFVTNLGIPYEISGSMIDTNSTLDKSVQPTKL